MGLIEKPADCLPTVGGAGRLIALEGIDGAGKTTIRNCVVDLLCDLDVVGQDGKELAAMPGFARRCMAGVANLLWPGVDTARDHLLRPQYWLYLQALRYTLLSQFVVEPKLSEEGCLLVDGWYYKFYVKLRMRGFEDEFLDAVFGSSVEPDLVILLDPDVATVWQRRSFALHEMGLHEGYPTLDRESFVHYQSRVRAALVDLANKHGWITLEVDAQDESERTAEEVARVVRNFLLAGDDPSR